MDPFLAEIRMFPFNFAPKGWAFCDGQLMAISQNTALFSLLGTTYGGDGKSNFALPNLQGQAPMFFGQGPGLSLHDIGETAGSTAITLLQSEIPSHSHTLFADATTGTSTSPSSNMLGEAAINPRQPRQMYDTSAANAQMLAGNLLQAGGSQPHNNLQPYLTLNFCIALQGVFPARN